MDCLFSGGLSFSCYLFTGTWVWLMVDCCLGLYCGGFIIALDVCSVSTLIYLVFLGDLVVFV